MPKVKLFNTDKALQKALQMFWEKGYEGTSIQELTKGLDISRSSLYDTYTDKYNLYLSSLELFIDNEIKNLNTIVTNSKDGLSIIRTILTESAQQQNPKKLKGNFAVQAMAEFGNSDIHVKELTDKFVSTFEKSLVKALDAAISKKQVSKNVTPKETAKYVFANYISIHLLARSGKSTKELHIIAESALKAISK